MNGKNNKKGFTIVELVIVIAVIAILAAVLIPTFSGVVEKANQSAVQQNAANKYKELYVADIEDGEVDAKAKEGSVVFTQSAGDPQWKYTVSNGSVTFTYTEGKYTVTYENGAWGDVHDKDNAGAGNDGQNGAAGADEGGQD